MPAQTRSDRVEDGKPRSSRGGVNLRDIASTDPSRIQPGCVYRSSERFKCVRRFTVQQLHTVFLAQQMDYSATCGPHSIAGCAQVREDGRERCLDTGPEGGAFRVQAASSAQSAVWHLQGARLGA